MENIYEFYFAVLEALQKIHSPVLDAVLGFFTYIGTAGIIWAVSAVIMLRSVRTRKAGISVIISLFYELIINEMLIKHIVQRPRPFILHPWVDTIVSRPSSFSFPSGHTCSSFAAATAIFCFNRKLGAAAYLAAALIGFSRNYFYIHFPTDVICGAAIGIVLGVFAHLTAEKLYPVTEKRFSRSRRE